MKHINKDHNDKKNSTIYTPNEIIDFLNKEIISKLNIKSVYDPAIGIGNLTNNLRKNGVIVYGNDIDETKFDSCDYFTCVDIEEINKKVCDNLDLILMNPPFNGHPKRKLYPEVFIDKMFELYGEDIPMIAIIPTGYRINQKVNSKRWRKVRDRDNITSIISLPLDIFEGVLFHSEIIIFNIDNLKPHYFLDI